MKFMQSIRKKRRFKLILSLFLVINLWVPAQIAQDLPYLVTIRLDKNDKGTGLVPVVTSEQMSNAVFQSLPINYAGINVSMAADSDAGVSSCVVCSKCSGGCPTTTVNAVPSYLKNIGAGDLTDIFTTLKNITPGDASITAPVETTIQDLLEKYAAALKTKCCPSCTETTFRTLQDIEDEANDNIVLIQNAIKDIQTASGNMNKAEGLNSDGSAINSPADTSSVIGCIIKNDFQSSLSAAQGTCQTSLGSSCGTNYLNWLAGVSADESITKFNCGNVINKFTGNVSTNPTDSPLIKYLQSIQALVLRMKNYIQNINPSASLDANFAKITQNIANYKAAQKAATSSSSSSQTGNSLADLFGGGSGSGSSQPTDCKSQYTAGTSTPSEYYNDVILMQSYYSENNLSKSVTVGNLTYKPVMNGGAISMPTNPTSQPKLSTSIKQCPVGYDYKCCDTTGDNCTFCYSSEKECTSQCTGGKCVLDYEEDIDTEIPLEFPTTATEAKPFIKFGSPVYAQGNNFFAIGADLISALKGTTIGENLQTATFNGQNIFVYNVKNSSIKSLTTDGSGNYYLLATPSSPSSTPTATLYPLNIKQIVSNDQYADMSKAINLGSNTYYPVYSVSPNNTATITNTFTDGNNFYSLPSSVSASLFENGVYVGGYVNATVSGSSQWLNYLVDSNNNNIKIGGKALATDGDGGYYQLSPVTSSTTTPSATSYSLTLKKGAQVQYTPSNLNPIPYGWNSDTNSFDQYPSYVAVKADKTGKVIIDNTNKNVTFAYDPINISDVFYTSCTILQDIQAQTAARIATYKNSNPLNWQNATKIMQNLSQKAQAAARTPDTGMQEFQTIMGVVGGIVGVGFGVQLVIQLVNFIRDKKATSKGFENVDDWNRAEKILGKKPADLTWDDYSKEWNSYKEAGFDQAGSGGKQAFDQAKDFAGKAGVNLGSDFNANDFKEATRYGLKADTPDLKNKYTAFDQQDAAKHLSPEEFKAVLEKGGSFEANLRRAVSNAKRGAPGDIGTGSLTGELGGTSIESLTRAGDTISGTVAGNEITATKVGTIDGKPIYQSGEGNDAKFFDEEGKEIETAPDDIENYETPPIEGE
jgi:hypothetical protein